MQARTPRPVIVVSGLAATTGAVAALASGGHGDVAKAYLLTVGFLPAYLGMTIGMPCLVDPNLSDSPTAEEARKQHREANGAALELAVFNTAVAGSTILLSTDSTSRVIAGIATGLSALSPLFYLGRFLDDGVPPAVALAALPPQLTVRF